MPLRAGAKPCRIPSCQRGFPYRGTWIKLTGPQGVFKPKELSDGPLTLLSTLASTYDDKQVEGDIVLYDYAPPQREYENDGLKRIARQGRAVILLKQVKAKPAPEYMVLAPVALARRAISRAGARRSNACIAEFTPPGGFRSVFGRSRIGGRSLRA